MHIAITRPVSASIARCELTHLRRQPIDVSLAGEQHRLYERCLTELGCQVERLPEEPDLPDAVFVEDTAIVLDEVAIISRPGAKSRRAETASTARGLAPYRELVFIQPPGTLDGGDVLRMGKNLYIGISERSNRAGIEQTQAYAARFGYRVVPIEVQGCLHLKSAVTQVGENSLLVNPTWVEGGTFGEVELIEVHPQEPMGANALLVGETVVYPAAFRRTRARLEEHDIRVRTVEVSELQKAEGGVTCCSLIFEM